MIPAGKNLGCYYQSRGPDSGEALDASAQVKEGVLDTPGALVPCHELLPEHHLRGGGRSAPGDPLALLVVDPALTLHCAPPWGPSYLSRPHPLPFMMPPSSVAECVVHFTSALAGLMVAAGPERIRERRVAPLPGMEASELVRGPACRVTAHTHSVRAAEAWVSGAVTGWKMLSTSGVWVFWRQGVGHAMLLLTPVVRGSWGACPCLDSSAWERGPGCAFTQVL